MLRGTPKAVSAREARLIQGSIARRYARALLEVAGAEFERVGEEIAGVADALFSTPELAAVFTNPSVPRDARAKVVEQVVAAAKLSTASANFLRVLDDRRRIPALPEIVRAYRELADLQAGRVRAKVISAKPLPAELATKIEAQLAAATNKKVSVETSLDPSLIGGVVAQVGNTIFDASLRTQLEALRRELTTRA